MHTLIIRHTQPTFQVEASGGIQKETKPVSLPFFFAFQSGIPNMSLMQGLQWYLEQFLAYPFLPDTEKKDKILQALHDSRTIKITPHDGGNIIQIAPDTES